MVNCAKSITGSCYLGEFGHENGHIVVSIRHLWADVMASRTPGNTGLLTGKSHDMSGQMPVTLSKNGQGYLIYRLVCSEKWPYYGDIRHL